MFKLAIIAFFVTLFAQRSLAQGENECPEIEAPPFGSMTCTEGFQRRSKCRIRCAEDYGVPEGAARNIRCRCSRGECFWSDPVPICEYLLYLPSTDDGKNEFVETSYCEAPNPILCDVPDFLKASYGVIDVWPTGAVLRVTVRPTRQTTQGWSAAVMFANPLPEGFNIVSGHVTHVSTSNDRRILTLNSKEHNSDISDVQRYSFYVIIRNIPENFNPGNYAALDGFYQSLIRDASCIQDISPVQPISPQSDLYL